MDESEADLSSEERRVCGDDNRALLLSQARRLWALRGYDQVGVQEVVGRLGLSKPTLYHYFGSKTGLLEAVLDAHFASLRETFSASFRVGSRDFPHQVRTLAEGLLLWFLRHPLDGHLHLALSALPPHHEAFSAWTGRQSAFYREIVGFFEGGSLLHGNFKGKESLLAALFWGLVQNGGALILSGALSDAAIQWQRASQGDVEKDVKVFAANLSQKFLYGIFS